ncbi:short-chain dehydrogenase/reductase SDR [Hyaloraphidium curvatum]|nr:short-chain dehydrogenase/reductase SDR [Hyaloraphidium curvatum]
MPRLHNASVSKPRVALVTGACSPKGIGRATARKLAENGAIVVVTDLPKFAELGKELVAEIKKNGGEAAFIPLDVSKEEDWRAAISQTESLYGPLDVLFNNAGNMAEQLFAGPLHEHPTDLYEATMDVNAKGVYFGIKHAAGSMAKRDPAIKEWASIINTASVNSYVGNMGTFAYCMSKHAVAGATKWAANNLTPQRIRVNALCPGIIATNLADDLMANSPLSWESVGDWAPMKRPATAEEMAPLVVFLASDESSYCTGGLYLADGGIIAVGGKGGF